MTTPFYDAPADDRSRAELAAMFGRPAEWAEWLVAEAMAVAARLTAEFGVPVHVVVGPGPGVPAAVAVHGRPQ